MKKKEDLVKSSIESETMNSQDEEEVSMEELLEYINETIEESLSKIEINTEECQNCKLNKEEFEKGVVSMSYMCGQISALQSCGLTASESLSFINGREIEKHNKELQKLINKGELEATKEGANLQKKLSL